MSNYVKTFAGIIRRLREKNINQELIESLLYKYKDGHDIVDPLKCGQAVEALKPVPYPYDSYLNGITLLDNATKLKLNVNAVKMIDNAINGVTFSKDAINEFTMGIDGANEVIKKDTKHHFGYENYDTLLSSLKEDIDLKIKKQHDAELKAITDLFDKTEFKFHLSNFDDREKENIKTKILEKLKSSHKEKIDNFNKKTTEEFDLLNKKRIADDARLAFLACIAECNNKNTATLENLIKNHQDEHNKLLDNTLGYERSNKGMKLLGIKASEITTFTSISGKTVTCQNGVYSIESSSFGFAISKADSYQIALAIRATLCERGIAPDNQKITTRISHVDKESAMRIAKEAGEAALEAGFRKENIILYVNNELKKLDELGVDASIQPFNKSYSDDSGNVELKNRIQAIKQIKLKQAPIVATANPPAPKP